MAFQSVPETAEVVTIYTQNDESIQMGFHAQFDGGYSQGDIDALADNVDARVATSFLPIQTADCEYVRTEARGLENVDDFFQQNFGAAGPGEIVSEGFPNMVTIAVQRNAGLTGRSSRGRVFWIGLSQVNMEDDENFITAATGTGIVAAVNSMAVTLGLSGWEPVIVSRFTLGAKREVGVTFPWINTLLVDLRVDTQKGRLP